MITTPEKIHKNIFLSKSIGEMISMIVSGNLSPMNIAEECIKRIEEYGDFSKVWVSSGKEGLLQQAKLSMDKLASGIQAGLLESIPVGVKDIFNTIDYPTQMGSPLWKGFTPGNDARVVYYLKKEGALIPGKTDTAEFAVHAIGNCVNPHDTTRTPGTSSSGSAVAVALGMVPAAIGTQTAGSIVRPASFCGVYGCKPSFGLLPRTGMLKTTDSFDSIGYFVSKCEDLKRLFEVLRVHGANYPISNSALTDTKLQSRAEGRPWKVAFVKTHTWQSAYEHTKQSLESIHTSIASHTDFEVHDAELPEAMKMSHEIHQKIYDKTLSYYFQEESLKPEMVSDIMNEIVERGNRISAKEYVEALEQQDELVHCMEDFFDEYDVLISHSTAGEAPLREHVEAPDPSLMWTLTHLPVVSCPAFVSPEGLPYGFQAASGKYRDYKLFAFIEDLRKNSLIPEGVNPIANDLR